MEQNKTDVFGIPYETARAIYLSFQATLPEAPNYYGIPGVYILFAGNSQGDPHLSYRGREVNALDIEAEIEERTRVYYRTFFHRSPTDEEYDAYRRTHADELIAFISQAKPVPCEMEYKNRCHEPRTTTSGRGLSVAQPLAESDKT